MTTSTFESTGLHFGEKLRNGKYGLKLNRDHYAVPSRKPMARLTRELYSEKLLASMSWMYRDAEFSEYSDAFLLSQRDDALINFDLSMQYFSSLDQNDFSASVETLLQSTKPIWEVTSLAKYDGSPGVYIMIFDDYKQYYVGQSTNIRKRIKSHWTARKSFGRLLFGSPFDSVFPVDAFRALDNTRLYVASTHDVYGVEKLVVEASDPRFSLNRVSGGDIGTIGVLADALTRPRRDIVLESTPATFDFFSNGMRVVRAAIKRAGQGDEAALVQELASLPTSIYRSPNQKGELFYWTYRYQMQLFLREGVLPTSVYEQYLRLVSDDVLPLD